MTAGLIADIVIALFIVVITLICTVRGFLRSVLKYASTFVSLLVVIFASGPLAGWLDRQFGWCEQIAKWNVPVVTPQTLLFIMTAIGLFLAVRLLLILVDKLLAFVKERVKTVNVLDHLFGFVFGILVTGMELTILFMLIDGLGLASALQLTPASGGYFAPYLFDFFKNHIFPIMSQLLSAVGNSFSL